MLEEDDNDEFWYLNPVLNNKVFCTIEISCKLKLKNANFYDLQANIQLKIVPWSSVRLSYWSILYLNEKILGIVFSLCAKLR